MNHHSAIRWTVFLSSVGLVLFASLAAGHGLAQDRAPATPLGVNVVVGTAFTYQGQLKDSAGNPISDRCDFRFILYDADVSGAQVGTIQDKTAVSVVNGYFTVALDFGSGAFSGDARWLEVAVKCSGDADYTTLSPRQALTATPYALGLMPGASVVGDVSGGGAIRGENWSSTGSGVIGGNTNGGTGVYGYNTSTSGKGVLGYTSSTSGTTYGVSGVSKSPNGYGVYAYNGATSGTAYGVYGQSASSAGTGVYGYTSSTSGTTNGVYGLSNSPNGYGVYGYNSATNNGAYGVYGLSDSPEGVGVVGYNSASSGPAYGVWGHSKSTTGTGVYGYNSTTSGTTYGIYGLSASTAGTGVYGIDSATSGTTYGVYGQTASTAGTGVYGYNSATSGATYGVYGLSISFTGAGVVGYNSDTRGYSFGVYGKSDSTLGVGVEGINTVTDGFAYGVRGQSSSRVGAGVFGDNTATSGDAYGVKGRSLDGIGVYGQGYKVGVYGYALNGVVGVSYSLGYAAIYGQNTATSGTNYGIYGQVHATNADYGVYSYGNFAATGTKAAVVNTQDYGWLHLYSMESPQVWFEDLDTAQLLNGVVVVTIDPIFAETVNLNQTYHVFLTPLGDCSLYVSDKTITSFTVRALGGQACSIAFDYRIVALRSGYEDQRLATAEDPGSMLHAAPPDNEPPDVIQP